MRSATACDQLSSTPTIAVPAFADQPLLDRRVILQRAVAVEMVFGDVEQDADRGIEARREIDLERRALDHMHAPLRRRLQREDRGADIAAELHVVVRRAEQMRHQRRRRGLAVGSGDRHERRIGRGLAPLAAEQLDVADHLHRRVARQAHGPVRRRMGERHAGREHQRGNPAPVDVAQIRDRNAGRPRLLDARLGVVERHDIRAAGEQRARARDPRGAEAEQRDLLAGECRDRDHRSFKVASPTSASPIEMIQNRITICGSVQPFCSK